MQSPVNNRSNPSIRIAGWAGIIAPIFFVVLVAIESLLRPGYSQISDEISFLGVGQYEILQNLNFIFTGMLSIIFGLGVGKALSTVQGITKVKLTTISLVIFGLGVIFAGIMLLLASPYPENSSLAVEYFYLHTFASLLAFVAIITAQFLTWTALRNSNRREWKSFRLLSLISGIVSVNLLLLFLLTYSSEYQGLTERLFVSVPLIWIEAAGWKLNYISKTPIKKLTSKFL